jgi:hypothetical protein
MEICHRKAFGATSRDRNGEHWEMSSRFPDEN